MKKNFVIAEKAIVLFRDELEGMFAAAEGCPEDSAYWWTRITEGKAEATPDGKVLIEVAPEQVERLLRPFEVRPDFCLSEEVILHVPPSTLFWQRNTF